MIGDAVDTKGHSGPITITSIPVELRGCILRHLPDFNSLDSAIYSHSSLLAGYEEHHRKIRNTISAAERRDAERRLAELKRKKQEQTILASRLKRLDHAAARGVPMFTVYGDKLYVGGVGWIPPPSRKRKAHLLGVRRQSSRSFKQDAMA